MVIEEDFARALCRGGSEDKPFAEGRGSGSALDTMNIVKIQEKIAEGGATKVGLIHLVD
jgi:CDGSH-type Zn-finger protein